MVSEECAVCGHNLNSTLCKCPWDKPFMNWPHNLLLKVKAMVKDVEPKRDWRKA